LSRGFRNIPTVNSVTLSTAFEVQLVNDALTPGNSKYYGTDSGGVKGYHDLVPGAQGPAGADGQQGSAGSAGSAGADGAQGLAGTDGAQGFQGFQGEYVIFRAVASNSVSSSGASSMEVDFDDQSGNVGVGAILYVNNLSSSLSGYVRVISKSFSPDEFGVEWIETNINSTVGWTVGITDIILTGPEGWQGFQGFQGNFGFQGYQGPAVNGVQVRLVHDVQFAGNSFQAQYKDVTVIADLFTSPWIEIFQGIQGPQGFQGIAGP
jgi:hypothetical protein